MDMADKIMYGIARDFKKLNLFERLELIPQSEVIVLKTVLKISEREGRRTSVSELSRRLNVSPPAISRTIKKLREQRMIACVSEEADRRNTWIEITDEGRKRFDANQARVDHFMRSALARLSPGEVEQFYDLSNKIIAGMRAEIDSRTPPM